MKLASQSSRSKSLKSKPNSTTTKPPSTFEDSEDLSSSSQQASIANLLTLLSTTPDFKKSEINEGATDIVKKVSKGALGELLAFLGEGMIGRLEVQNARRRIQHLGKEKGELGYPMLVELEKVKRRMKAARVAVEVARKKREDVRVKLDDLEREKKELEIKVKRARELGMALGMLEEKEKVRVKRIEEVKKMIVQLWKKVEDAKTAGKLPQRRDVSNIQSRPVQWRPKYTKETVAKLHGYHIRLKSGQLAEDQKSAVNRAEERLRNVMRTQLGREITDDEFRELLTTCKYAAEVSARQGARGYAPSSHGVIQDVQTSADDVRIKEAKVVALNDEIVVKLFVAEKYLQRIREFKERNVEVIRQTLREADNEARGYIGSIKESLVREYAEFAAPGVKAEYDTKNNIGASERLRRGLERCQVMEAFLSKLTAFERRDDMTSTSVLPIDGATLEERYGKILGHKLNKAKAGLGIAKEVEELVDEARDFILIAGGGKSGR